VLKLSKANCTPDSLRSLKAELAKLSSCMMQFSLILSGCISHWQQDRQSAIIDLRLVQMYGQVRVSIPPVKLMLSSVWGRRFLHGQMKPRAQVARFCPPGFGG